MMNHFMVLAVLLALRTCYTTYLEQGKWQNIFFFIWKQSATTEALYLLICKSPVTCYKLNQIILFGKVMKQLV